MSRPCPAAWRRAASMFSTAGSSPVTRAPMRARGSAMSPPPQPTSSTLRPCSGRNPASPARRPKWPTIASRKKESRAGPMRCRARNLPRASHHSLESRAKRSISSVSSVPDALAWGACCMGKLGRYSAELSRSTCGGCSLPPQWLRVRPSADGWGLLRLSALRRRTSKGPRKTTEGPTSGPGAFMRVAMAFLVMKFGGTSVANVERIRNVAAHVKREIDAGNGVAVVVSAMAGVTNQLVTWVREASPLHDAREYDAIVATGEQVTAGLLAIVLQSMGVTARSWQGWQIPIFTDNAHGVARIKDVPGDKIRTRLEHGEVAVITGFQGIEPERNRISTLGRGGSDTSAVAVAVAVRADLCDIYTDVDGVYTTDPRIVPRARRLPKISYEEMLEMASLGSKVLQTRSVELAMVHRMRVRVLSSFAVPVAIAPARPEHWDEIGTIICSEDEIVEQRVVSGIAYAKDEARVSLIQVDDRPDVAAAIFGPLADANINVDMIVQNTSSDGKHTDMTFTVQESDLERVLDVLKGAKKDIGYFDVKSSSDVAKVSVIGVGMRSHAGVAALMFKALAERGINILAITTSEIKISVLIDAAYAELAVRTLHALYGLDKD